ncbi:MarR family transcriptional regulator [Streptococcus uberis]|uniref:MarR family winged helix-turn-helix transcriptional regulator n=1 Tax=Streptococcus uberis TaxID=1349 RepID=UPI000620324B|nr:MarR family transcriptional regulator [Streptococcus uberis]KKF61152.1 MarR family transcriptional regulator [Streptococcus uberis B362]MCK1167662.1 MarR family transcriptional regulator [Streptococcus uberis]MCK1219274.1 MarR family transcriptional regulator [Streptococcus uberis]MCK1222927.1 MarR family transcriptional regulator [Streptococcus uberis]MCK1226104.1 MarR family transcriptional regulator [Streptococcus uberis]
MGEFKNAAVKSMVVMRKAFRTIDAKVSESYKEFELTPTQFAVLDVLYAKGTLKIGELINSMLATSGNMTVVIKNMEKKGWVERIMCPNDKRSFLVSLTEEGERVIKKALPKHIERVEETFSVLTETEQEELIRLLKKFKQS